MRSADSQLCNLSLGRRHIFALCDLHRYTSLRWYATIFCLWLGLGLGWRSDLVVFPWRLTNYI